MELKLTPEEIYQCFCRNVNSINSLIASYNPVPSETNENNNNNTIGMGDCSVYPERGTVIFSAGKQGWGFTLRHFARIYSTKLGVSEDKLVEKLWGDNFYDEEKKRWTTSSGGSGGEAKVVRGFCKFVLEPIMKMFDVCLSEDREKLDKMMKNLNLPLKVHFPSLLLLLLLSLLNSTIYLSNSISFSSSSLLFYSFSQPSPKKENSPAKNSSK